MKNRIEHSGVVESVEHERVRVRILQSSSCSACEARKLCQSSESKEKLIDCNSHGATFSKGDRVMVYGSMEMGWEAVLIAFVIPLLLIVGWIFMSIKILELSELAAIGMMVGVLALYYWVVYLFRHKINRRFEFNLEKIS